jgi:hypothetical protein
MFVPATDNPEEAAGKRPWPDLTHQCWESSIGNPHARMYRQSRRSEAGEFGFVHTRATNGHDLRFRDLRRQVKRETGRRSGAALDETRLPFSDPFAP